MDEQIHEAQAALNRICLKFKCADVYELNTLNLSSDQDLVRRNAFSLTDKTLINNQIKDDLLTINFQSLPEHEMNVVKNILWLWFQHATTIAIWKERNLDLARELCTKAISYLYPSHPNKITYMIDMLLRDDVVGARRWLVSEVNDVEKEYGEYLLKEYEKGVFR
jgi:hypothetical protein